MARQTRTNGRDNGTSHAFNPRLVLEQADLLTTSAGAIVRISDDVASGAEIQLRALDDAVSAVNEMSASLKETNAQADSIAASAEELVAAINEIGASIEQVTSNTGSLAAPVAQTAAAVQETSASIQRRHHDGTGNGHGVDPGHKRNQPRWRARSKRSAVTRKTSNSAVAETGAAIEEVSAVGSRRVGQRRRPCHSRRTDLVVNQRDGGIG